MFITHLVHFAKDSICYLILPTTQVSLRCSHSIPLKKNSTSPKKIQVKSFQSSKCCQHKCTRFPAQWLRRIPNRSFELFERCSGRIISKPLLAVRYYKNGPEPSAVPLYPTKYKIVPKQASARETVEINEPMVRGVSQEDLKKEMKKLAFKIRKEQQMKKKSIDSTIEALKSNFSTRVPTKTIKSRDFDFGIDYKEQKREFNSRRYSEKAAKSKHIDDLKNLNSVNKDVTNDLTKYPSLLIESTLNSHPTSSDAEKKDNQISLPSPFLYIPQNIKSKPLIATYSLPSTIIPKKCKERKYSTVNFNENIADTIQFPSPKLYEEKHYNASLIKRKIDYIINRKPPVVYLQSGPTPGDDNKNNDNKKTKEERKVISPPSPIINKDFIDKHSKGENTNASLWDFSFLKKKENSVKSNKKIQEPIDSRSQETDKTKNEISSDATLPSKIKDTENNTDISKSKLKSTETKLAQNDTSISVLMDNTKQSKNQLQSDSSSKIEFKCLSNNISENKLAKSIADNLNVINMPFCETSCKSLDPRQNDSSTNETILKKEDAAISEPFDDSVHKKNVVLIADSEEKKKEIECKQLSEETGTNIDSLKDYTNSCILAVGPTENPLTTNADNVELNLSEPMPVYNVTSSGRETPQGSHFLVPYNLCNSIGSIKSRPEMGFNHNKLFLKRVYSQNPAIAEKKFEQIEELSSDSARGKLCKRGMKTKNKSDPVLTHKEQTNDTINNYSEHSKRNKMKSVRLKKLLNQTHPKKSKRYLPNIYPNINRKFKRDLTQSCMNTISTGNLENNTKNVINPLHLSDKGKCKCIVKKTLTCEVCHHNNEITVFSEITKSEGDEVIAQIVASESTKSLDKMKQNIAEKLSEIAVEQHPLKSNMECANDNRNKSIASIGSNITAMNTESEIARGNSLRNTFNNMLCLNSSSIMNNAREADADEVVTALSTDYGSTDNPFASNIPNINSLNTTTSDNNQLDQGVDGSSSRKNALSLISLMYDPNTGKPYFNVDKPEKQPCEPPTKLFCRSTKVENTPLKSKETFSEPSRSTSPCPNFGYVSIDDYYSTKITPPKENIVNESLCCQNNQKDESDCTKEEETLVKPKELRALIDKLLPPHKLVCISDKEINNLIEPKTPTSPKRHKRRIPLLEEQLSQALSDRIVLALLPNRVLDNVNTFKSMINDQTLSNSSILKAKPEDQLNYKTEHKTSRKTRDRKKTPLYIKPNFKPFHSDHMKFRPKANMNMMLQNKNYKQLQTIEPIHTAFPNNKFSGGDMYKSNMHTNIYPDNDDPRTKSVPDSIMQSEKKLEDEIENIQVSDVQEKGSSKMKSNNQISKKIVNLVNKAVNSVSDSLSGLLHMTEDTKDTNVSNTTNEKVAEESQTKPKPMETEMTSPENDLKISMPELMLKPPTKSLNSSQQTTVPISLNDVNTSFKLSGLISIKPELNTNSSSVTNLNRIIESSKDPFKSSTIELKSYPVPSMSSLTDQASSINATNIPESESISPFVRPIKSDETQTNFIELEKTQEVSSSNLEQQQKTECRFPSAFMLNAEVNNQNSKEDFGSNPSNISEVRHPTTHLNLDSLQINPIILNAPFTDTDLSIIPKLDPPTSNSDTTNVKLESIEHAVASKPEIRMRAPVQSSSGSSATLNDSKTVQTMPIEISKDEAVSDKKERNNAMSSAVDLTTATRKKKVPWKTVSYIQSGLLNKKSADMKNMVIDSFTKKENPYKSFADLFPT